jgi:hypothetical protein
MSTCNAEIYSGSYFEQPSYCENDVVDGTDYCERHDQWNEPEREWTDVASDIFDTDREMERYL